MKRSIRIAQAAAWMALLAASPALADPAVRNFDWSQTRPVAAARVVSDGPAGAAALALESPDRGLRQTLLVIDAPGVDRPAYAVTGQVRYEGVAGQGYLEMWSTLPDGRRYFSRTLADSGPLSRLEGRSDWRAFQLPFMLGDGPAPSRLEINLVLPGAGRVWLGPLALVQFDQLEQPEQPGPARAAGAWWSDQAGGWVGGLLGATLGSFGALFGVLNGLGRARGFVLVGLRAFGVAGIGLLIFAACALLDSQPYGVWYPLGLSGALCAVLGFALLPGVRRRYEMLELRRMRSLDA
jgi:hypothetical protein